MSTSIFPPDSDRALKQSKRLWKIVSQHLDETECKHSLKQIVTEALE